MRGWRSTSMLPSVGRISHHLGGSRGQLCRNTLQASFHHSATQSSRMQDNREVKLWDVRGFLELRSERNRSELENVLYSTVLHSTVLYTIHYSAANYTTRQCIAAQCHEQRLVYTILTRKAQCIAMLNTAQGSTGQRSAVQRSTVPYCTFPCFSAVTCKSQTSALTQMSLFPVLKTLFTSNGIMVSMLSSGLGWTYHELPEGRTCTVVDSTQQHSAAQWCTVQ